MSEPTSMDEADRHDEHVGRVLNEYFDRKARGEAEPVEQLIADHPEVADDLREHFEAVDDLATVRGSATGSGISIPRRGQLPTDAIPGYEIIEEVSRGGMGVVYRARQLATGRMVAVKVMLQSLFASDKAKRRFEHEVETLASLQHPAIVPVYDSGLAHGQYFYVMPYVEGLPMDAFVCAPQQQRKVSGGDGPTRTRPWNGRDTLALFAAVADAVSYAHQHGVIHRDLKPSNILVDADGQPHILDFGLAKQLGQGGAGQDTLTMMSVAGQIVGTAAYMSPEQARGAHDETDTRTDVYAIGVMMFQILTGRFPYPVEGMLSETLRIIQEVDPVRPSSLSREVNPEVEAIVLKALAKEPNRRYQSAAALAEDLRRYLAGEPIDARRDSMLYVLKKTMVRHRRYAVMLLLVVALVGVVLAWIEIAQWRTALRESQRLLIDQVLQTNLGAAHWVARAVERELTHAKGMVEQYAERRELQELALRGMTPAAEKYRDALDRSAPVEELNRLAREIPIQEYLRNVARATANSSLHSWALASADATMLGRARYDAATGEYLLPNIIGNNYVDRDWYRGPTGKGPVESTHISEPYVSSAGRMYPMVAVAVPVWHPEGRERHRDPIGVLLGTLTLQHFADWLQHVPTLRGRPEDDTQSIDVVLVNDRYQFVLHPQNPLPERRGDPVPLWRDVEALQQVLGGKEGWSASHHDPILQREFLVGYAPVPGYRWGVLVQRSKEEARAPVLRIASHVRQFGWATVCIVLFVVLFLVIRLTLWIGRRMSRRIDAGVRVG